MASTRDDIAIVGMACRFPGPSATPEDFWRILQAGDDVVTQIDGNRWGIDYFFHPNPSVPGKSYTFAAGVLKDVDRFDADFFSISPREAAQVDPQQRVLLELAWEALENGGQNGERLAGSDCAVYVGISSTDYATRRLDDPSSGDAYFMTGGTLSIAANRISYFLDLHGPSLAIDTACSSSLVALHHACQGLWHGEFSSAIAGGVNMLLTPYPFIGFCKASMLAPDGRCRAFDAGGKGYVRSEGGALLFLKLRRDAEANGDPIHALIVGSGVNCDGRSRGLSMPRADMQEALLREVYRNFDVDPKRLSYVEAHGTGTAAGDPQEAMAIGRAFGCARGPQNPLLIGSVKTNVGHLESAAGMAGLVKVVLALKHRIIPRSLFFETPNPNIPFDELNLKVVTEHTYVAENGEPAVMGVNSFGFGGANAHVVVQEYPPERKERGDVARAAGTSRRRETVPLFLSARSERALRVLAARYRELLSEPQPPTFYDVAHAAATRRHHHEHRLAVLGRDTADVVHQLEAFATAGRAEGVVSGRTVGRPAKLALLFSGNGAQWQGMGSGLLATDQIFRRHVQNVDALLHPLAGFSVIDELSADPSQSRLHLTEVAQPLLLALQVGLYETLITRGIEVGAVCGHSVGEVAAAYAAGAYDLETAVRIIHSRSAAQAVTRGQGRMAAVGLAWGEALDEIVKYGDEVELAAINSPSSVTLSGSLAALEDMKAIFDDRGIFFRILDLDYAFHSRVMDPVRDPLLESLAGLGASELRCAFASSVTGTLLGPEDLGSVYWWKNVRCPVRFDMALATLIDHGCKVFLEVGPHPIMQKYVNENLRALKSPGMSVATLKRNSDDQKSLWEAYCTAHVLGSSLDFRKLFCGHSQYVQLPLYPWQRERHWHSTTPETRKALGPAFEHPLLGYRYDPTEWTWENQLDIERMPYLGEHVVGGAPMLPGSAFIELALAAADVRSPGTSHELEYFEVRAPIVFDGIAPKTVRFKLSDDGGFTISSRPRLSDQPWMVHAVGQLSPVSISRSPSPMDVTRSPDAGAERFSNEDHYRFTQLIGLNYGPAFQGIREAYSTGDKAFARIQLHDSVARDASRYLLHPALLDSCLQVLVELCASQVDLRRPVCFLPVRAGRIVYFRRGGHAVYCRGELMKRGPRSVTARFEIFDDAGDTVAVLEDFRFRSARLVREGTAASAQYLFRPVLKSRHDENAGEYLPRPTDLVNRLARATTDESYLRRRSQLCDEVVPLFEGLVAAFAYRAVTTLLAGEKHFTLASLMATAGIDTSHAPLLSRLVEILEEDGIIERRGSELCLMEVGEQSSPEDIWRLVLAEFPGYAEEATLVGRHGMHLSALFRAPAPQSALASGRNGIDETALLCDTSPAWQMTNNLVTQAVEEIVKVWPADRQVRILELSNGAVALAADLLTVLPKERCHYVVATPDETARANVQAAFADGAGLSVCELDINGELTQEELAVGSFDVVIATHILHRSDNAGHTLDNIRRLLARDALLLVLERPPDRQSDLVFGVQPQWWLRTIDIARPVSPLRSAEEWRDVLQRRGFSDVVLLPEAKSDIAAGPYLMMGRNPEAAVFKRPPAGRPNQSYLILADPDGESAVIADYVIDHLRADGHQVIRVTCGTQFSRWAVNEFAVAPDSAADFSRLFNLLAEESKNVDQIVHLMGLGLTPDSLDTDLEEVQRRRCAAALHLVGAASRGEGVKPRLWLITAGAAAVVPHLSSASGVALPIPSQAPLWGFGRVLMNEHPELQCRMIDLYAEGRTDIAGRLIVDELCDPDDEDEVLVTSSSRYGLRLNRIASEPPQAAIETAETSRTRLDFADPGLLSNLRWCEDRRIAPQSGEVEIRVRTTGLNFRDVMFTMGLLSEEAVEDGFAGATLGLECAGDVVRVGHDVSDFTVGDAVMCFGRACFASYVTTQTTAVARIPSGWTYEEAATAPCVFFTVYYALKRLAGLQRGERVLIHGAAGGVGLAAIQYARFCGAVIFATAGSEKKRDFLRLMGVDHVLNSRSLAFSDQIMELTGGAGVDVVLNSLSGAAVAKNLAVLRPFGRFLELGKRDFYENAKVGLRPFRNNISYFGIDADQLMMERPELARQIFQEMIELFDQQAFRPLAHRVFPRSRVVDAFRHMQQSDHIGKIVLSYDDAVEATPAVVPMRRKRELEVHADGSYLITGGLGGFGLATARWLVTKGARTLVLIGRSGAASPESYAAVAELEASGTRVHVWPADVAQLPDLRRVFNRIDRELPPLKGVVHAAMVLEDGLLRNMGREDLRRVLAPKMLGAWHLHQLTRELPLEFFVLYSSATTSFGNPSQANYVAANMYLETLAVYRRSLGLPALAVGWGPIGDVGFLAQNEKVREGLLARIGGKELSSAQALAQLERLLETDLTGVAVVDLDWRRLKKMMPGARSPKFAALGGLPGESGESAEEDIHALAANLSEDEVLGMVTELLVQQMADVLRMPAEKIARDASIYELGMDSLMALELHTAIEGRFGITIPITSLTEGVTTVQIATLIAAQVLGSGPCAERARPATQREAVSVLIARHGERPREDEVDAFVDRISRVDGAG